MNYLEYVLGDLPDLSSLLYPSDEEMKGLYDIVSAVQEVDETVDPEMRLRSYMIAAQKNPDFFSLEDYVDYYDIMPEHSVVIMASRGKLDEMRCKCHNTPEELAIWQGVGDLVKMAPDLSYPIPKKLTTLVEEIQKRFDEKLVQLYQSAIDTPVPWMYRLIDYIAVVAVPILTWGRGGFIHSSDRHIDMLAKEQKVQRQQAKISSAESGLISYLDLVRQHFTADL